MRDTHDQAIRELESAQRENRRLRDALTEIAKGEGAYSRDPLTHASNCIDAMQKLATDALASSSSSTPLSETPSDIAPTFSGRGFARWPMVTDNRGVTVEVAESSAASGPHIWVFTQGGEESYKKPMDGSAHLTLEQATALRDTLTSAIRFMSTRFAPASLAPLSTTSSEVQCSGCGIVAKQIAKPETLVGLQHYCGGTWRRSSLAPLSEPTSEGTNG